MHFKRVSLLLVALLVAGQAHAQKIDEQDRAEAREMLRMVADDIRKNYYDPKLLEEFESRVIEADAKIKTVPLLGQAFAMIGWAVDGLHDSHTRFLPPGRMHIMQYGWRMQFIGDRCYVTRIRPGSDAEKKGLRPGDQVLTINGLPLIREDFPKVQYIISVLAPQPELKLQVRGMDGKERQLQVSAHVREVPKFIDLSDPGVFYRKIAREISGADRDMVIAKYVEMGEPLVICKLREFVGQEDQVRKFVSVARKHQGLILDLRDNPGGFTTVLEEFLGSLFDHEIKIGDLSGRKPMKPMVAKPEKDPYTGKLIVLIDSNSASSSEIFARIIQLEKRGTVIGDISSGMVMGARFYHHKVGVGTVVFFGAEITEMDLHMPDGQTLEKRGVTPDEQLLPTPANLSHDEDPVLAHAAELLGVKISPAEAARLFPYEWPH
jgi:C-terminal processing protease CtpA/Prc